MWSTYGSDEVVLVSASQPKALIASAAAACRQELSEKTVVIGIACMTKQPIDLFRWLAYHKDCVGVQRFYLRVECTPELESQLLQPPWDTFVEATFATGTMRHYVDQAEHLPPPFSSRSSDQSHRRSPIGAP